MKKFMLIAVLVLALFSGHVFAAIMGNESEIAYKESDSGKKGPGGSSLREMIIVSAGLRLKSQAEWMGFLNCVEMAELNGADFPQMREKLDRAVACLKKSALVYGKIITVAENTPYNPEVMAKLAGFDHKSYRRGKGKRRVSTAKVAELLNKGEVTAVYRYLKTGMDSILEQLDEVKPNVDAGIFPDIPALRRINRDYGNSLMAGQYLAEVFVNLSGKLTRRDR